MCKTKVKSDRLGHIQKDVAPKKGVESCQKSIGIIRWSLAMPYDVQHRAMLQKRMGGWNIKCDFILWPMTYDMMGKSSKLFIQVFVLLEPKLNTKIVVNYHHPPTIRNFSEGLSENHVFLKICLNLRSFITVFSFYPI